MYDEEINFEEQFKEEHDNNFFGDSHNQSKYWYSILVYVSLFFFGFASILFMTLFSSLNLDSLYHKNPSDTSFALYASSMGVGNLTIVDENEFENSYSDLTKLYRIIYEIDGYVLLIHKDAVGIVSFGTETSYLEKIDSEGDVYYLKDSIFSQISEGNLKKWENGLPITLVSAKNHVPGFITSTELKVAETKPFSTPLMDSLVLSLSYVTVAVILILILRPILINEFHLFKRQPEKVSIIARGFINSLLIIFIFNFVSMALASLIGNANQTSLNQLSINNLLSSPLPAAISLIAIVCFGPIVEELIFRKSLMGLFKNDKIALLVSSFTFALIHITSELLTGFTSDFFVNLVAYLGGGFAFGYIYIKSKRNIWIPIIVHMLYNLLSVIMTFL
ncbi:MAG: CPBP family intramembrane metalloprotease [Candidatus Phytoplasma sp.]|nr:CPBP family intramembrane metalloprotease [Phytoplasma sp.]